MIFYSYMATKSIKGNSKQKQEQIEHGLVKKEKEIHSQI